MATVMLEVRDKNNWTQEEANIPGECFVLLDHLIRKRNPRSVLCGLLENEKAKVIAEYRKLHNRTI
jgi:hypothetical protein